MRENENCTKEIKLRVKRYNKYNQFEHNARTCEIESITSKKDTNN